MGCCQVPCGVELFVEVWVVSGDDVCVDVDPERLSPASGRHVTERPF